MIFHKMDYLGYAGQLQNCRIRRTIQTRHYSIHIVCLSISFISVPYITINSNRELVENVKMTIIQFFRVGTDFVMRKIAKPSLSENEETALLCSG